MQIMICVAQISSEMSWMYYIISAENDGVQLYFLKDIKQKNHFINKHKLKGNI